MDYIDFIAANFWLLFLCCLVISLVTWKLMLKQQKYFYTIGRVRQRFTILDLQFTSAPVELPKLLEGIDRLPDATEARASKNALRKHLYAGFIYMIGIYPLIFLLCLKTSMKMDSFGQQVFLVLAFAQALPLLCDAVENIYLLNKVKKPTVPSAIIHKSYQGVVLAKWSISCLGLISSLSALLYFWLTGDYQRESLWYLLFVFVLMGAALVTGNKSNGNKVNSGRR